MQKFVFDKEIVNNQLTVLNNTLVQQRDSKKTLLSYLEKFSNAMYDDFNSEDTEILLSLINEAHYVFECIKLNINKILELKIFLENIAKTEFLNYIDAEKFNQDFTLLFENISKTNSSYLMFMNNYKHAIGSFNDETINNEIINIENDSNTSDNINVVSDNTESNVLSNTNVDSENKASSTNLSGSEKTVLDYIQEDYESIPVVKSNTSDSIVIDEKTEEIVNDIVKEDTIQENIELIETENDINKSINVEENIIQNSDETVNAITEDSNSIETVENEISQESDSVETVENEITQESNSVETIENEIAQESDSIGAHENELIPDSSIKLPEEEPSDKISDNDEPIGDLELLEKTLLIYKEDEIAVLPYSISDLEECFSDNPEKYSSLQDIIKQEYTISLKDYENNSFARYKEAYRLAKDKSNLSLPQAVSYAKKLLLVSEVSPLIIAACSNVDELNHYLECLDNNDLSNFGCFKIIKK